MNYIENIAKFALGGRSELVPAFILQCLNIDGQIIREEEGPEVVGVEEEEVSRDARNSNSQRRDHSV